MLNCLPFIRRGFLRPFHEEEGGGNYFLRLLFNSLCFQLNSPERSFPMYSFTSRYRYPEKGGPFPSRKQPNRGHSSLNLQSGIISSTIGDLSTLLSVVSLSTDRWFRYGLVSPELPLWFCARRPPRRLPAFIHARRSPHRPSASPFMPGGFHAVLWPLFTPGGLLAVLWLQPDPRARPLAGRRLVRVCYAADLLLQGLPIPQACYSLPIWPPIRPFIDPVFSYASH